MVAASASASAAQLRAILGHVADGVNIVGPDARILLCNAGFLQMYDFPPHLGEAGTPLADFVRHRLRRRELYAGEDAAEPEEALVQARVLAIMAAPSGRFVEERPGGRTIAVRRERLADGTLLNTYRDTTLEREAARARRASRDALRRNERLSAIASLLAGVAHEINNPLAVISAQALLLSEEAQGTPVAARAEKLRLAAERCGRIVTSLLASARQRPQRHHAFWVVDALEAGIDLVEDSLRAASITLVRHIAPDLPQVQGDPDQIAHIVANLLANARDALQGIAAPRIEISLTRQDGFLALRVADNGPGIPPALHERVFDAFFTTKAHSGGTGVGLALCRTIAKSHGGRLEIGRTPGAGASISLYLPLPPAAPEQPG